MELGRMGNDLALGRFIDGADDAHERLLEQASPEDQGVRVTVRDIARLAARPSPR
jgi:hypothetical protein